MIGAKMDPPIPEGGWTCFHCDFNTSDPKEARSHFGDRDDEEPLCCTWKVLNADGKANEFQAVVGELDAERDENALLRTRIEGLEYQVEGQRADIQSFKPFRECTTIQGIFQVYDSMEGRALAAEERLKQRPPRSLLREPNSRESGCHCPSDSCSAPKVMGRQQPCLSPCSECRTPRGEQHKPSCHRQGLVTSESSIAGLKGSDRP